MAVCADENVGLCAFAFIHLPYAVCFRQTILFISTGFGNEKLYFLKGKNVVYWENVSVEKLFGQQLLAAVLNCFGCIVLIQLNFREFSLGEFSKLVLVCLFRVEWYCWVLVLSNSFWQSVSRISAAFLVFTCATSFFPWTEWMVTFSVLTFGFVLSRLRAQLLSIKVGKDSCSFLVSVDLSCPLLWCLVHIYAVLVIELIVIHALHMLRFGTSILFQCE